MTKDIRTISRRTALKNTAVGTATLAGLAGCIGGNGNGGSGNGSGGNGGGGGEHTITLASTFEPGHILVEAAEMFAEGIGNETDDAIQVEVVAGGAYGAEDEIADQVQDGTPAMHAGGGLPISMFASDYYFYDTPFVIEDLDHFRRLEESEEFQEAYEQMKEQGNQRKIGQFIYRGLRQFTSNIPIQSPEDVQGLNLRLPELDPWVKIWEEIGADPTPVALDELYSALQQGVAEASEGDAEQIHSFNLHEVQSHLSLTEHMVQTGALYMNEDFFQGLDESYQDAVIQVAENVSMEASQQAQDEEANLIDELEAEGMEVIEDVDQAAFFEQAEPAINQLFEDQWAGTWDEWRNV